MIESALEAWIRLGEALLLRGVMVAIRRTETDSYVYNNMNMTWTGYSLEEWNAKSRAEKLLCLNLGDAERGMSAYARWRDDPESMSMDLTYQVKSRFGEVRKIQCEFIKLRQDSSVYIVEISRCLVPSVPRHRAPDRADPGSESRSGKAIARGRVRPSAAGFA
jgi:hypothetical protein